jgi:hypothetical protein
VLERSRMDTKRAVDASTVRFISSLLREQFTGREGIITPASCRASMRELANGSCSGSRALYSRQPKRLATVTCSTRVRWTIAYSAVIVIWLALCSTSGLLVGKGQLEGDDCQGSQSTEGGEAEAGTAARLDVNAVAFRSWLARIATSVRFLAWILFMMLRTCTFTVLSRIASV